MQHKLGDISSASSSFLVRNYEGFMFSDVVLADVSGDFIVGVELVISEKSGWSRKRKAKGRR